MDHSACKPLAVQPCPIQHSSSSSFSSSSSSQAVPGRDMGLRAGELENRFSPYTRGSRELEKALTLRMDHCRVEDAQTPTAGATFALQSRAVKPPQDPSGSWVTEKYDKKQELLWGDTSGETQPRGTDHQLQPTVSIIPHKLHPPSLSLPSPFPHFRHRTPIPKPHR